MPILHAVDVQVDVDFEVYCDVCGEVLCNNTRVKGTDLHITPCSRCMYAEYERGKEKAENA